MEKLLHYKPYIAVIIIQCSYAGMFLLSKAAMSSGMKPSIFVAYRQAVATFALLPFALLFFFFSKRKESPPLTWGCLCKIFLLSSFGLALGMNLNLVGLEYISATFSTAIYSVLPVLVFIMALCLRIETLAISKRHGMAKVFGTIIIFSGAMAFTFYKGPPLFSGSNYESHMNSSEKTRTKGDWIKGSFISICGEFCFAMWLTLLAPVLKKYPGKLRLTILQSCFSCITATVYGAVMEREISLWKLGWNIDLLAVAYSGIIVAGISYWLQAWLVENKGPVFSAIFGPLAVIVAAIFSALFLKEALHWGRFIYSAADVLGAGLLVVGLYSFLWGRNQEDQIKAQQKLDHSIQIAHV